MYVVNIVTLSLLLFAEPDCLDPLRPSSNTTASGSTIITVTVVTSVSIFALFSIVCGLMLIKLCQLKSAKSSVSLSETLPEPCPLPDAQMISVYETVFPMEFQEENMELNDNIAYGTVHKLPAARVL